MYIAMVFEVTVTMSRLKFATLILLAGALFIAGFGAFALRYSHAAAWRVPADQRPWVDRTLDAAAAFSNRTREDFRRTTRPRLWRSPDRICVILASHRAGGGGSYHACFEPKNGHLIEEREYGEPLGPARFADPLWERVW